MAKNTNTTVDTTTGEIKNFTPIVKRQLNFPLLSQKKVDTTIYITILSAMKEEVRVNEKGEKEKSITVIVMDLESDVLSVVLLSTVQVALFTDNYPEHSYVGLSFQMTNNGKREGKKYNDTSIIEIETPDYINVAELQKVIPQHRA